MPKAEEEVENASPYVSQHMSAKNPRDFISSVTEEEERKEEKINKGI